MSRHAPRIDLEQFLTYRISVLAGIWGGASGRFYRRRFGLALREWRVMAVLSRLDGGAERDMAASEIARLTAVEKAGISRALASLERRGLVSCEDAPDDARRTLVTLTPAGRALLRKLAPAALARQASLASILSAAERRTLFRLLEKLERRATELARET